RTKVLPEPNLAQAFKEAALELNAMKLYPPPKAEQKCQENIRPVVYGPDGQPVPLYGPGEARPDPPPYSHNRRGTRVVYSKRCSTIRKEITERENMLREAALRRLAQNEKSAQEESQDGEKPENEGKPQSSTASEVSSQSSILETARSILTDDDNANEFAEFTTPPDLPKEWED
ncbi:hypothetical protein HK102_006710, partial [Quaeritorhiza haematococci]